MAVLRVYKRNSTFIDVADLVEEISSLGLDDALQKYHNKALQREAKSIVAGPSFLQFLNKLFQIQITKVLESVNISYSKEDPDIAIVLGGDGTFGYYGRILRIPMLFVGINDPD